jgi:hypothetical protein
LPAASLAARAHSTVLDEYDAATRPIGIRYDPFRVEGAAAIAQLATLTVAPGVRGDPQPIRVLHNGRFSLPAGRYHVDVEWSADMPRATPLALQIGRIEPAWQTWDVQPARGGHWSTDVGLPVDAGFVAFRGSVELERAIGRVTIAPLEIVDAGARPRLPEIYTAAQLGTTLALFHDDNVSPETNGFWVLGDHDARVTLVRESGDAPLVLRVHSGLQPNRVTIAMRGWQETLGLHPRAPQDITLPDSARRVVTVDIHPETGFHPRDLDPASRDPRFLGAWVEVVK